MGLTLSYYLEISADIHYFVVSNRVYVLSNNVGILYVFTHYYLIHPFRLVLMFSGTTAVHVVGDGGSRGISRGSILSTSEK